MTGDALEVHSDKKKQREEKGREKREKREKTRMKER